MSTFDIPKDSLKLTSSLAKKVPELVLTFDCSALDAFFVCCSSNILLLSSLSLASSMRWSHSEGVRKLCKTKALGNQDTTSNHVSVLLSDSAVTSNEKVKDST